MFGLVTRKGVFSNDYVNSWKTLEEKQLPSIEFFYSKLKSKQISVENYVHAKTVWEKLNISTLGQYADLYLKVNIMLLCDCIQNFRELYIKNYQLNASAFYTIPRLPYAAALKLTNVKLELLTDISIVLFCEKAIPKDITQVNITHVEANNRF